MVCPALTNLKMSPTDEREWLPVTRGAATFLAWQPNPRQ